ncbi:hypothetical protein GCM10007939_21260 [Amylibacter marinus]|uniref:YiaAB two helix domain-containing protein n=1 Tax=Amylibacter marinus TaxID=1475483 RepID=A0ABQ5VX18_9RHOB|nr:hypothetical protein [Amylibacter marinus]GLQ35842.1 hypothetical protein GCM10007939_21260 [Amylibacter marinus]
MNSTTNQTLIIGLNAVGVIAAYVLLGASLYLSTDVPLATKGYWGMAILLLTISLINVVKYRFDSIAMEDRINQLEAAKNEKILAGFVNEVDK